MSNVPSRNYIVGPYSNRLYRDERPVPVPRFCVANNCGLLIFPQPFQHESNFCDVCISRIRCNPPPIANNGDASQFFTPGGEFPHELYSDRFRQPGGSDYVPLAPTAMRSGHPPIHHVPPSVYFQQPRPIPHPQTLGPDRMAPTFITYLPEDFAGTSQRVSRNVLSNTCHPAPGLPHEFISHNRQPNLQLRPLHCEECRIFMSNRLVGDGRVCSRCLLHRGRSLAISAKPSSPFLNSDSFRHKDAIDLTGNDDDGLALMADTASAVKTITGPPNRIKLRPPLPQQESSSDRSPPSKRQRIDVDARNASTGSLKNINQPTTTAEGNASKICSTPSCGQTIPVESCGSRCISCVKLDWKSVKDQFKTSRPHHELGGNMLPSTLATTKGKPKKSVTWSDTVIVASGDGTTIQCLVDDVEEDRLSDSDNSRQDGEGFDTPIASTDSTCLELEARMVETHEVRLAPLGEPIASITGWDSDLSELTESDESDDSPQISAPTGLKIRIPARSSIFCSRKCRNPLCSRVLASNYPRKTCMMCRVQHRRVKQLRKGLHDKDDVTMPDDEPPKPIRNARLCSASECTHFIPPYEEYKFKRCSLCHLYQEEQRLLRRRGPSPDLTKPLVDEKKIYHSFRSLPVRFPTSGRCLSLDCGLLQEDGTTLCQQCVSRRATLMKKAGIQEEHQEVKQDEPHPKLNVYPQYICYAFLLSDLESRLKGFLKSQTIFFLFRTHNPRVIDTKALFSFDGEYSVVSLDFDVIGRKTKMEFRALKTKKDLEGIEGLKFASKRLISILEGGGVAIRFRCTYQASILRPQVGENVMTVSETMKPMTGELEIAVFPDHSHRCLPGEKTIIRFRLLG